jgi:hypothetical protein
MGQRLGDLEASTMVKFGKPRTPKQYNLCINGQVYASAFPDSGNAAQPNSSLLQRNPTQIRQDQEEFFRRKLPKLRGAPQTWELIEEFP